MGVARDDETETARHLDDDFFMGFGQRDPGIHRVRPNFFVSPGGDAGPKMPKMPLSFVSILVGRISIVTRFFGET